MSVLSNNLKKYRKKKKLSPKVAALALKITRPILDAWEAGMAVPDATLLPEIARLYRCDLNALFDFTPPDPMDECEDVIRVRGDFTASHDILSADIGGDLTLHGSAFGEIRARGDVRIEGDAAGDLEGRNVSVHGRIGGKVKTAGDLIAGGEIAGGVQCGGDLTAPKSIGGTVHVKGDARIGLPPEEAGEDGPAVINGHLDVKGDCTCFADVMGNLSVGGDLILHGVVKGKIDCGGRIDYSSEE